MNARRSNLRTEARQTLLIWSCMERVWSILTQRYFTEVSKGILLPPMFAELQSTRLRRDKVLAALTSVLSVFSMSLLLFIQDSTASTRVWMPVCSEQNSSGGAFCEYQLSTIGILVRVATESINYIRQWLGVQREQDRSRNGTMGVFRRQGGSKQTKYH